MEELLQNMPPVAALLLGLFVLVWVVTLFLVPFMVEGIRTSTRKTHEELREVNRKLERLNTLLAREGIPPAAPEVRTEPPENPHKPDPAGGRRGRPARRDPAPARGERKEPIISDSEPAISDDDPHRGPEPRLSAGLRRARGR